MTNPITSPVIPFDAKANAGPPAVVGLGVGLGVGAGDVDGAGLTDEDGDGTGDAEGDGEAVGDGVAVGEAVDGELGPRVPAGLGVARAAAVDCAGAVLGRVVVLGIAANAAKAPMATTCRTILARRPRPMVSA